MGLSDLLNKGKKPSSVPTSAPAPASEPANEPVAAPKSLFAKFGASAGPTAEGTTQPAAPVPVPMTTTAPVPTTNEAKTGTRSLFKAATKPIEPPAQADTKSAFRFASPSVKQSQGLPVALKELGGSNEIINLQALENFELGGDDFDHPGQPREFSAEEAESVRALFKMLEENIDHKDAVSEVVYTITAKLQSNPNFKNILRDEDFGLMVRGMRRAYGVLAAKKGEAKAKRAGNSELKNEFLMGLKDINFGR